MIKHALEYLVGLGKTEVIDVGGQKYSTKGLHHVKDPVPEPLKLNSLTGIVDYIKTQFHIAVENPVVVQVDSHLQVSIRSQLKHDANRDHYAMAQAIVPTIRFGCFFPIEEFNIMMQSMFVPSDITAAVLKVVGNIKEEKVKNVGDDGVSQVVTAKTGIARVEDIILPNPVILAPYRTFAEVEQPASRFVFRMKEGPQAALFEADGGAWKLAAMLNIADYLKSELAKQIESGLVHVIS